MMRILMIGDIVGKPGRRVVQQQLPALKRQYQPDLVIANGENAAGGSGITPAIVKKLLSYGIDAVTLGDHAFRQADIQPAMNDLANLIRPANLPDAAPGNRAMTVTAASGAQLNVITVLGRLFVPTLAADDPFATVDRLLDELPDGPTLVEIHAEATSEKVAMGHYLDGRVAAVVGTHTHIPTADAKLLPGGTAYITDLGMTGPYDSVLGRRKDRVIQFMTTAVPAQFSVADGDVRLCGVFIELDDDGKATRIERVEAKADMDQLPFSDPSA